MKKGYVKVGYDENATWRNSHAVSQNINNVFLHKTCCEKCGSTTKRLDVHHKDGDWKNNQLDNLQVLCRSCHNKEHRQAAKCIICGDKVKGYGYCEKHYRRFKKYGDPRKVKKCNGQIIELEN